MSYSREKVVDLMRSWIGKRESNNSHREIIDIYNTIWPLPRGYKVKYSDSWCAATVSAAFHRLGYDDIFPMECGCNPMIAKAQEMGIWVEDDSYVPKPGDVILYDWQDNGVGDNKGGSEHVGIVENVIGKTISVIEGNHANSVKRRDIEINGRFIRGYITPKFDKNQNEVTIAKPSVPEGFVVGKVYTLNANMNVRKSANGEKLSYVALTPDAKKHAFRDSSWNAILCKGTRVTCKAIVKLNTSVWMQIPSGWVCAIGSSGKQYIS